MYYTRNIDKDIETYIINTTIKKGLSDKSTKAYKGDLNTFSKWIAQNNHRTISNNTFTEYLHYLKDVKKQKGTTIQRKYIVIKSFLNHFSKKRID